MVFNLIICIPSTDYLLLHTGNCTLLIIFSPAATLQLFFFTDFWHQFINSHCSTQNVLELETACCHFVYSDSDASTEALSFS